MSDPTAPIVASFPQDPCEFDADPRISFSKLDNKYILETENGDEYMYEPVLKRWVPSLDESLIEQQREAYKVPGVDEDDAANPNNQQQKRQQRKRKQSANGGDEGGNQRAKKPRVNTAVYVTSIPLDATLEEVHNVFCKCGVIAEEIDSHRPRIKMYTDENGKFKGDALVVYFRPESVDLAVQMLDDSDFRLGQPGPEGKMRVQPADFSFKAQKEVPAQRNPREKQKILKKTKLLNEKLADWEDEDPQTVQANASRWEKIMVLKHMFTLKEIEEDPAAILDIKEDIREECSKVGEVTNVVLYDKEPEGVVTVRFSDPEATRACIRMMNGRYFGGTRIEAYMADGKERFRKTNEKRAALLAEADDENAGRGGDKDDEEAKRLDEFGAWLESEGAKEKSSN
ncbi:hypothetical protein VTO42DRAFT_8995 [Malbranchea cinnamomea]